MANAPIIVLSMGHQGHPEDLMIGKTLVYTGQEKSKKYDDVIPAATVLLFTTKPGKITAFRIEFHRQIRVRNEPDPRNPGVLTFRPLYEFRIIEEIQERVLPHEFEVCLENKVKTLLKLGLMCETNKIGEGILRCRTFTELPSLYSDRMMRYFWKRDVLVDLARRPA